MLRGSAAEYPLPQSACAEFVTREATSSECSDEGCLRSDLTAAFCGRESKRGDVCAVSQMICAVRYLIAFVLLQLF